MWGVICNTNDKRKNQELKNENEKNNDLDDEKNEQISEIESPTTKNTPNNNIPITMIQIKIIILLLQIK